MSKPSIAELLNASGHTIYTPELVQRAMYSLYGNVGANLDERDWSALLQSSDPFQASEDALRAMYQDSSYLLRNTQHLTQSGYVAAQAEITYRQMADRLGYIYNPSWSDGTAYDYLGDLTYEQLVSLVPTPAPPPPLPTLSVSASEAGFTVALNVAGTVSMSVSGSLGSFAAGNTLLSEQTTLKEGFLTLAANGNTSAATSQYVVLGTGGDESIDASGAGMRVDYLFGGAGNDSIHAGNGDDVVVGGVGNDTITGGLGVDTLYGGDGDDTFRYLYSNVLFSGGASVDTIDGGAGNNTLILADRTLPVQNAFVIAATDSWSRITNISRIEAEGPYGAQFNLVLSDDAYEAGLRVIDLSADTETTSNDNFINVSAETGAANGYTLIGHGGTDFITGGAGNDSVTGGAGADTLSGGAGDDVFLYTDNLQLREDSSVAGGDGFDSIEFSVAIDTLTSGSLQGDNFHADFEQVTGVERIKLAGASLINLGDVLPGAGITTIATGNDNTTLRYDNIVLGTLTIDATALADNKTLTLTQFGGGPGAGQWFNITNLKGDVNAAGLQGGISVTVAAGTGFDVSVVSGEGDDTLVGGAGNDALTGGNGADLVRGGAGADVIYLGIDASADTVRADEGDGQMLISGEIAHLDSDRVEQFNATHDKFVVSGAGTSVILNGVGAAQTAGTAFQYVTTGTFDLNGTVGGAYITGAGAGNLRKFDDVKAAIGTLTNESVGEEAYFVLRDGAGAGNAGVYHFRSVTANGEVDVGEIELLGLVLTSGDLGALAAGNFLFA